MFDLISQIVRRTELGETVALCTVVGSRGSTPQEKGAKMLVLADGKTLGTLGGGCVEAEVRVCAQRLMTENQNRLLSFSLNQDFGWDDGLVCGGVMDIAMQIFSASRSDWFRFKASSPNIAKPIDQRRSWAIDVMDESLKPAHFEIEIPPTPTLLIAGAGHVGRALATIARQIDFNVVVIDDRA